MIWQDERLSTFGYDCTTALFVYSLIKTVPELKRIYSDVNALTVMDNGKLYTYRQTPLPACTDLMCPKPVYRNCSDCLGGKGSLA